MPENPKRAEVVVIGAGPAGLATGSCLRKAGVPFVILERGERVGQVWHRHYDRLQLHSDKDRSSLPHLDYPDDYPKYPSRKQVIDYLEAYAKHFELEPIFKQRVEWASYEGGYWYTTTQDSSYISKCLVVATGNAARPRLPSWPGQELYTGELIHSSQYKRGEAYRGRRVLVVGFGNSGGEIAIDLSEQGAQTHLAVRSPVNVVPRDLYGMPIIAVSAFMSKLPARIADVLAAPVIRRFYGDIETLGLKKAGYGPFSQVGRRSRVPLIDVGTVDLIRRGEIEVHPGINCFTETGVVFTDGAAVDFDAVVLATGYKPAVNSFILDERATEEDGTPRSTGCEGDIPGLFFCGFHVAPTGMFRQIAFEAERIARIIARRLNSGSFAHM